MNDDRFNLKTQSHTDSKQNTLHFSVSPYFSVNPVALLLYKFYFGHYVCTDTHGEGRCPHKLIKVALFRYYVANRIAWSTYQSSQSLKILPQLDCFCLHLLFCGRLGFDKRNQYEEMASTHIHLIGACNKKIKCPRHFCTCSVHLTTPIRWW